MDNRSFDILNGREKGQFPLSIATSLALEGALGILEESPHLQNPTSPPINEYNELWINIRTLYRNLHSSMQREVADTLPIPAFVEALHEELVIIQGIIADKMKHRMKMVAYACTYRELGSRFPHAKFRTEMTDRQKVYSMFENGSIEGLLQMQASAHTVDIRDFNMTILADANAGKVLLMTHYPVDLLTFTGARQLGLLESHTGVIKKQHQWYTKLKDGKDLVRIPFSRMSLQMFGDSAGMFYPYPIAYRRLMLECAQKYNWTQTTTKDRVLLTVGLMKNFDLEKAVRELS